MAVSSPSTMDTSPTADAAFDISSWLGLNRDKILGKASKRFSLEVRVLVFEANAREESRYRVMTDKDEIERFVNRANRADLGVERALGSKAQGTDGEPPLGTNRIFFIDFVPDPPGGEVTPVEKRQLQITSSLFEFICRKLNIPNYFVDTVTRDDQLGRLGFGSYLHPGEDKAPGTFELSYRYTPRLQDGTLDLNGNLHYIYTRYNIRSRSSFTLCINPHEETRNLWIGYDRDPSAFNTMSWAVGHWEISQGDSVGRTRARRDLRSPLGFHILVTQMTLEDWRNGLKNDRDNVFLAEKTSDMAGTKPGNKPPSLGSATEVRLPASDEEQATPLQPLDTSGSTKRTGSTDPKSRKGRLRHLHITAQRLTVAENSCRDIENRVSLLLRSVETLRSIPDKGRDWLEHASVGGNGNVRASDIPHGIPPSTLDREQQILESIQLSCQHSKQWTRCYRERTNIQIELDFNQLTSDVAWEAQRDTSAMNNIAVVTTLFLPGTFICAVFSMIFSNSDANDPSRPVSLAYLYAAVTVPVTVVIALVLWFFNHKSHEWRRQEFDTYRTDREEKRPRTLGGVVRSVFLHSPP
ncbi:hypothetical protein B0T16DRAFT_49285 [Cercophora newfieldiana]|uniref:Uncharacterized protein n=1 Tax=Cercophora newfieldiana TaxID=92897 RepID=A0AA39YSJ2_9PEZI|nr:hypothetical protein B0T16DRAFT_49285 [Cercophora newfieldiana]